MRGREDKEEGKREKEKGKGKESNEKMNDFTCSELITGDGNQVEKVINMLLVLSIRVDEVYDCRGMGDYYR